MKWIVAAGFLCCYALQARAELNFCNGSPLTIYAAVGEPDGGGWRSRGWYKITPGECSTVIGGNLGNRYYYAYAESDRGARWKWEGDATRMCTSKPNAFTIQGYNCAQESHGFDEIDVAGSASFDYWFTCPDCLDPGLMNAIRSNTGFLEQVANSAAPLSFRTPDWVDIGPVDIQYGVSRGPFRISIEGNQVKVATRLSYWLSVSHVIPILGRNGLAQCGINEAQPYADVELTTIFGVDSDGHVASKTRVTQLSFPTPCNLTVANIDARPYIQQAVDPQINSLASTIDAQIRRIDLSGFLDYTRIY
jgi:uncharacterized membrane protein